MRSPSETLQESEKRWAKEREELTAFLKDLGLEYPDCGYHVGDGWLPHTKDAIRKMAAIAKEAGLELSIGQVKQKFCQLRIYWHVETPGVTRENHDSATNPWLFEENHPLHGKYEEIEAAAGEAARICDALCEDCPNPSTYTGPGSGTKLCQPCKDEWAREYKEKYGEDLEE